PSRGARSWRKPLRAQRWRPNSTKDCVGFAGANISAQIFLLQGVFSGSSQSLSIRGDTSRLQERILRGRDDPKRICISLLRVTSFRLYLDGSQCCNEDSTIYFRHVVSVMKSELMQMCCKRWKMNLHYPLVEENANPGLTCMLVFAIFAAVLGMFQFGYNTGVINAPQKIIQKFITDVYKSRTGSDISDDFRDLLWSFIVSAFAVGGMIGGLIGGSIANKFGRKGGLLVNNAFGIIGAALMGSSKISQSIEILVVGRLIIGINCGINTALVPMYLSEISPLTLRGGLGTVNQLGITIGLLLSQVLGIEAILGTAGGWPFLFGITVIPAVLQLLILPLCPESPRYLLISKQQESLAREALQKLRCSSLVEEDIEEMKAEDRAQLHEPETAFTEEFRIQPPPVQITIWKLLKNRSLHLPLVIGVVMQLTQQLSGINAVLYYSTGLFMGAGLPDNAAKYATIGVGVVMVIMTLISIPLMDRKGRRTLQLYGLGGMFIFSIFITITMLVKFLYYWIAYLSVVSTLFFVVFYAMGPGPIPWMITAELFSQGPRPAAMSITVTVNWFANFVVGLVFPIMQVSRFP
ncbi:glucose transporter type 1, partial [Nephila pilipes]